LANSTLVAFVVTLTGVALASTTGYAFSRYSFVGKKAGMLSLLVTQMFPATMLLLPMYIMLVKLHLINTYLGIVIMYSATALPFCIWQMKGYYDTIPTSLEEAGRIDGASQFQIFFRIILPLASPALVITALFSLCRHGRNMLWRPRSCRTRSLDPLWVSSRLNPTWVRNGGCTGRHL
jgi:arabinogalactan oligomer/maltooligosaccharide transport system permease protein